jgi:hypothetical protein
VRKSAPKWDFVADFFLVFGVFFDLVGKLEKIFARFRAYFDPKRAIFSSTDGVMC